jgi:K+-transporting ATPase ATPase B chain
MFRKSKPLFDTPLLLEAASGAFQKLDPRVQVRNPVMFVVYIGSIITTFLFVHTWGGNGEAPGLFILGVAIWLWATLLFANFAEALAEGRGKAQAATLRAMRTTVNAKKLSEPRHGAAWFSVPADNLVKDDVVLVEAGDVIPCDGQVIEGVG